MLQVYSRRDIPWILVEGQPSAAARRTFGAMRHEGGFPVSRLTDSEHHVVMREIRDHEFARIPKATAQRLLSTTARTLKGRLTRWLPLRVTFPWQA
jgi:hypothetical protein